MYKTHSGTCNSNTDSIRNYIVKIAFTRKVILHMQCAFQAVSQQLDTRSLWNSLRGKIKGSYYDSWPLLDFPKCGMCRVFTQQVTYFVVRLPLAFRSYIQETPTQWQKMFVYLLECSNSELLHSVQETMHQSRGQTTHLYWLLLIHNWWLSIWRAVTVQLLVTLDCDQLLFG